jgi:hypothetical protein
VHVLVNCDVILINMHGVNNILLLLLCVSKENHDLLVDVATEQNLLLQNTFYGFGSLSLS